MAASESQNGVVYSRLLSRRGCMGSLHDCIGVTEMSYDQNIVVLTGRLTRDPEPTTLASGKAVTKFTLAVGHGKDSTSFIDCEAWGKPGEMIAQYLVKGEAVSVTGSIKQQTWDDKNGGGKRSKLIIVVSGVNFVPQNKPRDGGNSSRATGNHRPDDWPPETDGDVPF